MSTPPDPPAESVWARGSRTLTQACEDTGLSRRELIALCEVGVIPYFPHGNRGHGGTWILAWGPLVELHERLHEEHLAERGTGVRTSAKATTKSAPKTRGKK